MLAGLPDGEGAAGEEAAGFGEGDAAFLGEEDGFLAVGGLGHGGKEGRSHTKARRHEGRMGEKRAGEVGLLCFLRAFVASCEIFRERFCGMRSGFS